MSSEYKFPELTVVASGSSGIEIRAKLPEQFNCVEFTLRDDVSQPVFISPWIQFEPVRMNEFRLQIANEVARRALVHDELVKKVEQLQNEVKTMYRIMDRRAETQDMTFKMWREERERMGLPADFSDIKVWPPELMNGYDMQRSM